jgi:hypothetical protein
MFNGLDDDDVPIPIGTPTNEANAAIAPVQPEWDANTFDRNAVFDDLGITFVDVVPVVPSHDDEPDTLLIFNETPEDDEEEDNNDGNVYARELPFPSMEGCSFRQPALDTVVHEMFENLQMRCLDMQTPEDPAFVE